MKLPCKMASDVMGFSSHPNNPRSTMSTSVFVPLPNSGHNQLWFLFILFRMRDYVCQSYFTLKIICDYSAFLPVTLKISFLFFFFGFLGLPPRHMVVPRLGVESELQLSAYSTATATRDPSCICDLHRSSWQCQIFNPPSKARD